MSPGIFLLSSSQCLSPFLVYHLSSTLGCSISVAFQGPRKQIPFLHALPSPMLWFVLRNPCFPVLCILVHILYPRYHSNIHLPIPLRCFPWSAQQQWRSVPYYYSLTSPSLYIHVMEEEDMLEKVSIFPINSTVFQPMWNTEHIKKSK